MLKLEDKMYKVFCIICVIFNIVDYISTTIAVHVFGSGVEANPFMRYLIENKVFDIYKLVVVSAGIILLGYYSNKGMFTARAGIWVIFIVYTLLMLHHTIVWMTI